MGIGADLRQAREAAKISLDTISQKTKISVHYLEAIESEEWSTFPSLAFARGFLRAYAKMVRMDPAEATVRFNEQVDPGKPVAIEPVRSPEIPETNFSLVRRKKADPPSRLAPPPQELSLEFDEGEEDDEQRAVARVLFTKKTQRRSPVDFMRWAPILLKAAGALVVAALLVWAVQSARHAKKSKPPQPPAAVSLTPTATATRTAARKAPSAPLGPPPPTRTPVKPGIAPPARPALPPPKPTAVRPPARPAAPPPAAARPKPPAPASSSNVGGAPGASAPAPMADGFHHLVLKGVEPSWIKVVIDGQTAWSFLLETGATREYKATQGFRVRVGNAAGAELTVNGQALGKIGAHGQVVELLLPTGYRPPTP